MTTLFTGYSFKPNDGQGGAPPATLTIPRTLPDAIADIINVKDYGAIGDGTTDDTAAIKLAFATAWGTPSMAPYSGTPHALTSPDLNKPIFFPAGTYKVTDTIYVESVYGGWVFGAGSRSTKLLYAGHIPNVYPTDNGYTNLFFINGMNSTRFDGISFVMTNQGEPSVTANTLASQTCCFNWNWDNPSYPAVNSSALLFIDVGFSGATVGLAMADSSVATGGNWGYECDVASWINCWAEDCYNGIHAHQSNCLNCVWYGGSIKDCSQSGAVGMNFVQPIWLVQGCDFSNNDFDYQCMVQNAMLVDCKTTSSNFAIISTGASVVIGCVQDASAPGHFIQTGPGSGDTGSQPIIIDGCTANGDLYGRGGYFISGSNVWRNRHVSGAVIHENDTSEVVDFADLPDPTSTPAISSPQGLVMSIQDSSVTTWASNAAGGGANHVLVWSNGTNWKVVGK